MAQDQGRLCSVHVHVDAHGSVFPGPRLLSSPLPSILPQSHRTVGWRAQTDSDSQAAIAANHAGRWRHRCEACTNGQPAAAPPSGLWTLGHAQPGSGSNAWLRGSGPGLWVASPPGGPSLCSGPKAWACAASALGAKICAMRGPPSACS